MHQSFKRHAVALAVASLTGALLAACGGGSGGDEAVAAPPPAPPAATVLRGTAASGAAMAGASIKVIDADTATVDPAAVTSAADGSYRIDISALKAPLVVQAVATIDGSSVETLSVVPSLVAGTDNTANVTPLTHAVAALIAPAGDPKALLTPALLAANGTSAKVASASALVVNTLATDSQIAAALGANFNPLSTAFSANGSGIDSVLDKLSVTVSPAGVAITNLAAALSGGAAPTPVLLTPAQTATPTVVPTLPATAAAGNLPTAAELAALGAKFEACMALPLNQRVTLDTNGEVTAVLGVCNYAAADWKSQGRNWAQDVGQYTFAKNLLNGAKVGKGTVVLALAPVGATDAKELKHSYCNTGPCVVVRYPATTVSGRVSSIDWLLAKVNGAWNFVGNQQPYRVFVDPRLNRKINVNRDGPAAGNAADPYFFKDRYESVLRLVFDLNSAGSEDIRAVRFSGPGLPAAGVVVFRSQRCGSDDRMGITYQNGSTRLNTGTNVLQFWTGGATVDFVLDAANLDGSALAMPVPVLNSTTTLFQDFSPQAVANQQATIPAWSRYKIEIFRFSANSDVPDEMFYTRVNAAAENASAGAAKPWPSLAASYIDAHLKPTGAMAGAIDTVAGNLPWAALAGTYVSSGYLFSQNFATLVNAQNESGSYARRGRLDYEVVSLGNSSAPAFAFADPRAGTAMSSFTSTSGNNPNPRCTSPGLVPLTANAADYREAGLSFRGSDRKQYGAIWYWDN